MTQLRALGLALMVLLATAPYASAAEGLVTKPSTHSVDETLDRLEAALKERKFIIFNRIDHSAAAQSVGLKMPRSTLLVYGNPRVGTPRFLQQPTFAIEVPPRALVWADTNGKVWVSYNTSEWMNVLLKRHGLPPVNAGQGDAVMDAVTDAATK